LSSPLDVVEAFLYFFVKGSNAEQRLDTKVVFDELVKLAYTMTGKNLYAGGNALTMARRIAIERQAIPAAKRKGDDSDQKVVLLAQIDKETTTEMDGYGVHTYGPISKGETRSPDAIDVHFALEYQTGDTITIGSKSFSSPRMNRYYMNSDEFNTKLKAADSISRTKYMLNTQFLIISGLQVLDRNDFKAYSVADPLDEMAKFGTVHGSTQAPSTAGE
jgi:hypothetical protein